MKLKPCPFCGGHAESDSISSFREFVSGKISRQVTIYCEHCTANITICVPDVPGITVEHVAEMWNERHDTEIDQLRARVAELEEKLWAETKALNAERIATTSRAEQIEELKEAVAAYAEQLETIDAYRTVQAIIRQQAEQIKVARAELQRVKAICLRECGVGVVDENVLAKLSPDDSPV